MNFPRSERTSPELLELMEEFLQRFRDGQRPSVEEYQKQYPQFAQEIASQFTLVAARELLKSQRGENFEANNEEAKRNAGQVGPYQIAREIGRGGMGIVYEAYKQSDQSRVALKILPLQIQGDRLDRFHREVKATQLLAHPNIVRVLDAGQDERGVHYYAMQFIEGYPLDQVFRRLRSLSDDFAQDPQKESESGGNLRDPSVLSLSRFISCQSSSDAVEKPPCAALINPKPAIPCVLANANNVVGLASRLLSGELFTDVQNSTLATRNGREKQVKAAIVHQNSKNDPLRQSGSQTANREGYFQGVAQIGLQVADALAHAHDQRVLHRDIKPSNILINDQGQLWITDFGLAKNTSENDLTTTGDVLGTLRYMSPERFKGQSGESCDVYGLGITLYELLTLRQAFQADSQEAMIDLILHKEPATPVLFDHRIPRDLETIVLKSIAKASKDRYESARAMRDDLGRFLQNRPIVAKRPTPFQRFWRWQGQNLALAGLIYLVGLAFAASFCLLAYNLHLTREAQEQDRRHLYTQKVLLDGLKQRNQELETQTQKTEKAEQKAKQSLVKERQELYLRRIAHGALQIQTGQYAEAVKTLKECEPQDSDEADLRGWEWNYLRQLVGGELLGWDHQEGLMPLSVSFSPDGTWAATTAGHRFANRMDPKIKTGELRVWSVRDGRLKFAKSSRVGLSASTFSPDGSRIAALEMQFRPQPGSGAQNNEPTPASILVFDLNGKLLAELKGAEPCFSFLASMNLVFTPDGRHIVSSGPQSRLTFWDAQTGAIVKQAEGEKGRLQAFAMSLDGRRIVILNEGMPNFVVWDVLKNQYVIMSRFSQKLSSGLALSHDGRWLLDVGEGGHAVIWDLADLTRPTSRVIAGHPAHVRDAVFHPDGRFFATVSDDSTVRVWKVSSTELYQEFRGHFGSVVKAAFAPDGRCLASVGENDQVKVWDMTRPPGRVTLPCGESENRYEVGFDRKDRLVTLSKYSSRTVWDPSTGDQLERLQREPTGGYRVPAQLSAFAADVPEGLFAENYTTTPNNNVVTPVVRVLRGDGGLVHELVHDAPAMALAFRPDGRRLAVATYGLDAAKQYRQGLQVWNLESKPLNPNSREVIPCGEWATILAYDQTGQKLAYAHTSRNGQEFLSRVSLWDGQTSHVLPEALVSSRFPIIALAWSRDGQRIAASNGSEILVQSTKTDDCENAVFQRIPLAEMAFALAFHPDGVRLAASSRTGVTLWHLPTGNSIFRLDLPEKMPGDYAFHCRVAFNEPGTLLAATNWNGNVTIWDGRDPDLPLVREERLRRAVYHPSWDILQVRHCYHEQNSHAQQFHLSQLKKHLLNPIQLQDLNSIPRLKPPITSSEDSDSNNP